MRIVNYGRYVNGYMNDWQYYHIRDELRLHDCEVEYFNIGKYESLEQSTEALLKYLRSNKVDLFCTGIFGKDINSEIVEEVKRMGIPTLFMTGDQLFVAYEMKELCKPFDLFWLATPGLENLFEKWGANVISMPSGANPNFLKPQYPFKEVGRVGFVGNPHSGRQLAINTLTEAGIPVTLHCKKPRDDKESLQVQEASRKEILKGEAKQFVHWMRYPIGRKLLAGAIVKRMHGKPLDVAAPTLQMEEKVPFGEFSFTLQKYALSLNFSEGLSTAYLKNPVPMMPLRCMEIPMAGGVQFVRRTEGLEALFEDEKEIIYFDDYGDMVEKAEFWLRDDQKDARDRIRVAARTRMENENTWWHRYSKLFEMLGIGKDTE